MKRREFLAAAGMTAAAALTRPVSLFGMPAVPSARKKRIVLVGTGVRGISLWGKTLLEKHGDLLEFVGLCDINPGRAAYAKTYMGVDCPTFTNFEQMMDRTKPDAVIVTTVDGTHHEFIIKGLEMGAEVITEKPMTTDEDKCRKILQAEKRTGRKVHVGFNYRYGTHFTKIKEILASGRIGRLTSVDFHWYLNTDHGASYFRRWHGIRKHSGTLLVHKATHHFDLLNWWIDSDPIEVHAFGALEHYGHNNPFRHTHCRPCPHKDKCRFFWDITKNNHLMNLYVANEKYDGYLRDACLWRPEIDIFDKMAVQIKYANGVQVSYSLTTYSPFEGWQIAFNGFEGRLDSWDGIPWEKGLQMPSQDQLHAMEMKQDLEEDPTRFNSIMVSQNFGGVEQVKVPKVYGGHGGGDARLRERLFAAPNAPDPLGHAAGSRDGAMSILVGIAARKSIDTGKPVKIKDLTDLVPQVKRIQAV
ncbi:MAG: Gfo/Idh/MocA family oxidoreductase [Anaerohalosphaeraceae bacterium]